MNQAEVLSLVSAIEMSLLPCLPARELQAMDRSAHPSHQGMSTSLFYVRVYAMKTQSIMHAHSVFIECFLSFASLWLLPPVV